MEKRALKEGRHISERKEGRKEGRQAGRKEEDIFVPTLSNF